MVLQWMMVVLDTNVIISALYSRRGKSNRLIYYCLKGDIQFALSPLVLWEYMGKVQEKINEKLIKLPMKSANVILAKLCDMSHMIYNPILNRPVLPDLSDEKLLECAISANASHIITYNIAHFPKEILSNYSIKAALPKSFLNKEGLL